MSPFSGISNQSTNKAALKKETNAKKLLPPDLTMNIPAKPWTKKGPPKRILAIRMQAMGDTVITLPYLQDLRNNLPSTVQLDLLTRYETNPIPKNLVLFNKIYSIGGKRNLKKQLFFTFLLLPKLIFRRYDVIIDLQNNILSRLVRRSMITS